MLTKFDTMENELQTPLFSIVSSALKFLPHALTNPGGSVLKERLTLLLPRVSVVSRTGATERFRHFHKAKHVDLRRGVLLPFTFLLFLFL